MLTPLSVEIIKDATTPEVNTNLPRRGIRYVSQLSKGAFMLVSGPQEATLIKPEAKTIGLDDTYDLIPEAGKFRVFLTGRTLNVPALGSVLGYAQYAEGGPGGLAVVSTIGFNKENVPPVTAHELGHLLHLSYSEGEGDAFHCTDSACLMYHTAQYNTLARPNSPEGSRLENRLYCHPCEVQVGRRALRLMYEKKKDLV